ncbi:hypothetical protein Tco_1184987 [Tanacetum coccineum]
MIRTSILVIGSPTSEFSLKRGLRQCDPLSPFLFIIVMKGLHIALRDTLAANMFRGVKSNLYGVGVSSNEVVQMTAGSGCIARLLPLTYLGLPIVKNPDALRVKVVKSIHGDEARMDMKGCQTNGLWARIVGEVD